MVREEGLDDAVLFDELSGVRAQLLDAIATRIVGQQ